MTNSTKEQLFKTAIYKVTNEYVGLLHYDMFCNQYLIKTISGDELIVAANTLDEFCL